MRKWGMAFMSLKAGTDGMHCDIYTVCIYCWSNWKGNWFNLSSSLISVFWCPWHECNNLKKKRELNEWEWLKHMQKDPLHWWELFHHERLSHSSEIYSQGLKQQRFCHFQGHWSRTLALEYSADKSNISTTFTHNSLLKSPKCLLSASKSDIIWQP